MKLIGFVKNILNEPASGFILKKELKDYNNTKKDGIEMANGIPKRDGSGKGNRANRGRGGCATTKSKGKGRRKNKRNRRRKKRNSVNQGVYFQ